MSRSVSAPSSVTNTSPCWNGFMVPGSTLRYGSSFCMVTRRPRALSSAPRLEAVSPLPREEATPPVTKRCLVGRRSFFAAAADLLLDTANVGLPWLLRAIGRVGNGRSSTGYQLNRQVLLLWLRAAPLHTEGAVVHSMDRTVRRLAGSGGS